MYQMVNVLNTYSGTRQVSCLFYTSVDVNDVREYIAFVSYTVIGDMSTPTPQRSAVWCYLLIQWG